MKWLPYLLILLALVAVGYWVFTDPTRSMVPSVPGNDESDITQTSTETVNIGDIFEKFADETSDLKDTWTQFRGANSDNIKHSVQPLLDKFIIRGH